VRELDREPDTVIFNQFSEFGNHLAHYLVTGRALERVFEVGRGRPGAAACAFVSATGSAGTLGAGDYLKERLGTRIVAVEALECPTMLENGFGEHNIQGIGDKHIPLIHNVMNTDYVVGGERPGHRPAQRAVQHRPRPRATWGARRVPRRLLAQLGSLGLSSICNVVAAIKLAKHARLGPDDAIVTVATDGAPMYHSERDRTLARDFPAASSTTEAAPTVRASTIDGAATDHMLELTDADRRRIFNLGYYTWVEQQGISFDEFVERRDQTKCGHDVTLPPCGGRAAVRRLWGPRGRRSARAPPFRCPNAASRPTWIT
jgi:cysteine synthase